jgi:hypothetical protein
VVRGSAFAFLIGELGNAVASEDTFEGYSGFVPDLTGSAERGFGDVADTASRATGRPDLTVQNLHNIQHRNFLGGHGEAVSSVGSPTTSQNVCPAKVSEDLLQETLRDPLSTSDLRDPHRGATFAQRQFHQRSHGVFTLLCKSQIEIHLLLM